jgi:hypothetical protein
MSIDPVPTPQHDAPVPGPSFVWWCAVCRREESFTEAELVRFARDGWPVCCGRQVYCYAPVVAPGGPESNTNPC